MEESFSGHKNVVRYLIKKCNAKVVNKANKDGKTALNLARERKHLEVEKILLKYGATS